MDKIVSQELIKEKKEETKNQNKVLISAVTESVHLNHFIIKQSLKIQSAKHINAFEENILEIVIGK